VRRRTGSTVADRQLKRRALAILIAALPLVVAVCDKVVGPSLPADAVEFSPPPVYTTWWQMTQSCSGLTGSMNAVAWYKTDEVVHDTHTGDVIAGFWLPDHNQIVLNSAVMMDGGIVRHEMLHALRQKGGHPRDQFLGSCAGTVDCEEACIADAGPYPTPPETPLPVGGDGIDLTVAVEPPTPSHSIDEGRFSITVYAHNRSTHWVTVTPGSAASAPNQTFSIDVHGANGATAREEDALDPSQTIFGPGETKRHVFDLAIGDYPFANQLLPGDYTLIGAFAGWTAADNSFTIAP